MTNARLTQPLLAAKLSPPTVRAEAVARSRLLDQLHAGRRNQLLIVVAPPGFGKTTLLATWIAQQTTSKVAWVSLDERDNDPTRFWDYLLAALDQTTPGVGDHARSMLRSPQPPPIETVISALLDEIAVAAEVALVLDDYHVITAAAIHDGVGFLLDHLPTQLRLVVSSRSDPPFPLARLRLRGQLTELRADDLRFTSDEAAAFLTDVMGLTLTAADISTLETRTEGWIGALHLAALSLRGQRDPQAFIAAFAGSHRYLVDYLADEVLRRQPEPVQRFLLDTAILAQMCAPLCDSLRDEPDASAQMMLETLEQHNLFVVPLDTARQWYRYHTLFAEFLRERLQRQAAARVAVLHQRAAHWYEAQALPIEAVEHALASGDLDDTVALIERVARPLLLRSESATLLRWLTSLPYDLVQTRPELCVLWAWSLAVTGQFDDVETYLAAAERAMEQAAGDADEVAPLYAPFSRRNFASEVVAVRATVAGLRRDTPRTIALARQALAMLPEDSVLVRAVVALMFGAASYQNGDMAAARASFTEVLAISQQTDIEIVTMFAFRQLGDVAIRCGQLRHAQHIFAQALDFAAARYPRHGVQPERPLPIAGTAYVGLGLLFYEWNELGQAVDYLGKGLLLGRQGENVEILLMGPIGLARTQWAQGDAAAAQATMQQTVALAQSTGVPRLAEWIGAEQAQLALMVGDVAAAVAWARARQLDINDEITFLMESDYLVLAWTHIAQGWAWEALSLLARLAELAEREQRTGSLITTLALIALAHSVDNNPAAAHQALGRALALAAPEGYVRTFVDFGEPMQRLLSQHSAESQPVQQYVQALLAAFADSTDVTAGQPDVTPLLTSLVEPLTSRETEVLQLIAGGLSNQDIADNLVVGLSTVKKHINNIYGKLGVTSRTQALVRARELRVIE